MIQELAALLHEKSLSIASVESLTAGLFSAQLGTIPGASSVLYGALVTYQTRCKKDVLKINDAFFCDNLVISSACAKEMVIQANKQLNCDIIVSCTGNAGPDTMDDTEAGTVFIAISYLGHIEVFEYHLKGNREQIRMNTVHLMAKISYDTIIGVT